MYLQVEISFTSQPLICEHQHVWLWIYELRLRYFHLNGTFFLVFLIRIDFEKPSNQTECERTLNINISWNSFIQQGPQAIFTVFLSQSIIWKELLLSNLTYCSIISQLVSRITCLYMLSVWKRICIMYNSERK